MWSTLTASDTVTRILIFDSTKKPCYIIRQNRAKSLQKTGTNQTVKDYLDIDGNKADATNFHYVSKQAAVEDGKRILDLYRVTDIFVSERGFPSEAVIGWVPDDHLRRQ